MSHIAGPSLRKQPIDRDDSPVSSTIHLVVLFCYKYIAVVTILAPSSQEKEKTSYMSGLYFYKDRAFFRAEGVYLRKACEIEAIFCERVTSYTKTFDCTFIQWALLLATPKWTATLQLQHIGRQERHKCWIQVFVTKNKKKVIRL